MSNWNSLKKRDTAVAILTALCQDYILEDAEFSEHPVVEENKNDSNFWIEMGAKCVFAVDGYLKTNAFTNKKNGKMLVSVIEFALDLRNRLELNDILYSSIENYLNNYYTDEE